ncbi:MAG TPA: hypothetical protein P5024_12275 [Burkholderiaceae bacterium]|nr:hypothetical protein [Burkholderiaceae bacterium]
MKTAQLVALGLGAAAVLLLSRRQAQARPVPPQAVPVLNAQSDLWLKLGALDVARGLLGSLTGQASAPSVPSLNASTAGRDPWALIDFSGMSSPGVSTLPTDWTG